MVSELLTRVVPRAGWMAELGHGPARDRAQPRIRAGCPPAPSGGCRTLLLTAALSSPSLSLALPLRLWHRRTRQSKSATLTQFQAIDGGKHTHPAAAPWPRPAQHTLTRTNLVRPIYLSLALPGAFRKDLDGDLGDRARVVLVLDDTLLLIRLQQAPEQVRLALVVIPLRSNRLHHVHAHPTLGRPRRR